MSKKNKAPPTVPSTVPSTVPTAPPTTHPRKPDGVPLFAGQIPVNSVVVFVLTVVAPLFFIGVALWRAYAIRLLPIKEYGYIIHEFDPWFNYRATEYMDEHGWSAFFSWFDYMSWYPLGRPVGSTIYPGLQITAVTLKRVLNAVGIPISLNNLCVLMPAWFASISTLLLAGITYETTQSLIAAAFSAHVFAIVPGHLMRSMAGEYDNECIAMAAMLLTFYTWIRSIRCERSWPIGVLTGLAYGYMVAAWGGYIFVLNMVALHAGVTVAIDWLRNRYDSGIVKAYTLFFVIGTAIATRVPPVGMAPFKSLEQLMALLVLLLLWTLHLSEPMRRRAEAEVLSRKTLKIRLRALMILMGALFLFATLLAPKGYFGPLSSRVRALFVQHTRTGNPLVDSVAEHQQAGADAFWIYLHMTCYGWWVGIVVALFCCSDRRAACSFVVLNAVVTYYFSTRMARLMLLAGPSASCLTGVLFGKMLTFAGTEMIWGTPQAKAPVEQSKRKQNRSVDDGIFAPITKHLSQLNERIPVRSLLSMIMIALLVNLLVLSGFSETCQRYAVQFSNPQIIIKARVQDKDILVDDYYKSYMWLRESTPEDARVLAWWDYGYQITGIGNRTSLADGNTWNHEHIATIGKMLSSPVEEAHSLIRHVADYVLIWAGQLADDLSKSPHMARIGNSVYRDICPNDPLCSHFGFKTDDFSQPTTTMRRSLLYNLHSNNEVHGVVVNPSLFQEVYRSQYGLVRIYKVMNVDEESKRWIADPKNRKCDPPGSWVCPGQYPPVKEFNDLLAKRMDFGQLEDFNRGKRDDAYYREYMKRSGGRH